MKKQTLTWVQFYKANSARRKVLATRFGFNSPEELMAYLKANNQITNNVVNSYEEFNKLSKDEQLQMAFDNGYSTIAAYKSKLRAQFKKVTPSKSEPETELLEPVKPTIISVFILDESSSMQGAKAKAMLEGVQNTIKELVKQDYTQANYLAGVVGFSYSHLVDKLELKEPMLVRVKKTIMGGMTALNDAVYTTLNSLQPYLREPNTKAVVQIFTDGGENASSINSLTVASTIKDFEAMGVTVTFMGTATDVENVKKMYSLKEGNTLIHENTAASIGETFISVAAATVAYSKAVIKNEEVASNFYSKVIIEN